MKATIYYDELKRLITATKDFVAGSPCKPAHTFIRLEFYAEDNQVRACAADGCKLSTEWGRCAEVDEDFVTYIQPTLLEQIGACQNILFTAREGHATVTTEFVSIHYVTPREGEFLAVDKAIPHDKPEFRIGFDGRYLMDMLKAAYVRGTSNRPVIIEFRGALNPAVLKTISLDGKENIKLVMPMRLKADI